MLSFFKVVLSDSKLATLDSMTAKIFLFSRTKFVSRDLSTSGSCALTILLSKSISPREFLSEKRRAETWLVVGNGR
ncbi:hypothetical protein BDD12DRAFT_825167 [Trichophaea hybrida]|nr:hypothetical protein BDD12DRAFT_825167 [Trichophaea hybrida]